MSNLALRWSDLDPNFHLRHSAYYDLAAQDRIEILHQYGITINVKETGQTNAFGYVERIGSISKNRRF